MKRGVFLSALGAVVFAISASGAVIDDQEDLFDALDYAKTGDTVKLKAGTISVTGTVTIVKGITLSGGWSDETTRAEGAVTVLHGGDSVNPIVKVGAVKAEGSVTIENLCFTRAWRRGLYQCNSQDSPKDSCDLFVENCRFIENGVTSNANNSDGLGAAFTGTDSSVTVRNSIFAGNLIASTNCWAVRPYGGGIYAKDLSSLAVEDCDFLTNGVPFSIGGEAYDKVTPCYNGFRGAAIAANGTKTSVSGCRFIGNVDRQGATVMFYNASGGSCVSNCLFSANHHNLVSAGWSTADMGTINVNMASPSDTLDVYGCTIAYNCSDSKTTACGVTVTKGAVTVRNSILYGNTSAPDRTVGSEIAVTEDGSLDIAYSLVGGTEGTYCSGGIAFGAGVLGGDPLFVTGYTAVTNAMQIKNGRAYFDTNKVTQVETLAYDLHLRSQGGYCLNDGSRTAGGGVTSPAIDAGDPASPYPLEPRPNGRRVNLGFYGNTAQASMTPGAEFRVILR